MAMKTLIEMSNHCTIHAKRVTLIDKDIRLISPLVNIWNPNSRLSSHCKGEIR